MQILTCPAAILSFLESDGGTVVDQHDDMETPTEVGKDRMRGGASMQRITEVQMESSIMICMLESNSNLKGLILFPPSELAGFWV